MADDNAQGASFWTMALIMSNILLGGGLLYFSATFHYAGGLWNGLLIQLFIVLLIQGSQVLIVHCSDCTETDSYQAVVYSLLGRVWLVFVNVLIIIQDMGACATYLIIIADQVDKVISHIYGSSFCHVWYLNRDFTLSLISTVFILPFCIPKKISSFEIGSILAVLTTVYLVAISIFKYYTMKDVYRIGDPILYQRRSTDYLKVVSAYAQCYLGHIQSIPVYASLKNRNLLEMLRTTVLAVLIAVAVYNLVGVYGYLTFGPAVKTDFFTNYEDIDTPIILGMAMLAVKFILAFPPVFYCPRLVIMDVTDNIFERHCGWGERTRRVLVTCLLFYPCLWLALFSPNVGFVINIIGGTAALFLFLLPGWCYVEASLKQRTKTLHLRIALGVFYVGLGAFLFVAITTDNILNLVTGETAEREVLCL